MSLSKQKLISKLVGTVVHLAPRGAYRTLCGISVELAKSHVRGFISAECGSCFEQASDSELYA